MTNNKSLQDPMLNDWIQSTKGTVRIYGASCIHHAKFWLDLRNNEAGSFWTEYVNWTARWPAICQTPTNDGPAMSKLFWGYDLRDIAMSDAVMLYAQPKDELRGALVEAGIALGMNKIVILVGKNLGFGTWQHHTNVFHCHDVAEAQQFVALFNWRNIKGPWVEKDLERVNSVYEECLSSQSR